MTINQAIELLKMLQVNLASDMDAEDLNALQLGIEALKRVEDSRGLAPLSPDRLLPGETEE